MKPENCSSASDADERLCEKICPGGMVPGGGESANDWALNGCCKMQQSQMPYDKLRHNKPQYHTRQQTFVQWNSTMKQQLFYDFTHQSRSSPRFLTGWPLFWGPEQVALLLQRGRTMLCVRQSSSSSRMCVINHNWSATKQRPHCKGVRCPPIFSLSNLINAGWLVRKCVNIYTSFNCWH